MKLEQHFYTSGKPEFMTVAVTDGINREERLQLEQHSIYFLPVALHYQEQVTTPVKYIWYPLGADRFVLGRAIYKGKDSLGRTGNYLFHNLVLSQAELLAGDQVNPVSLLKQLRDRQVFRDDAPPNAINPLEFKLNLAGVENLSGLQETSRDLVLHLLYACIHANTLPQPLLLLGTADECLDLLEQLYFVLPYDVRLKLQVDTYAYGVSLGFQILGTPDQEEFRQGLTSSITLRLATLESAVTAAIPEPSKYLLALADLGTAGRLTDLNTFFAMEYRVKQDDYARFKQAYPAALPELQQMIWQFYSDHLLNHVTAEQDLELLHLIETHLKVRNIDTLYLAPEMIYELVSAPAVPGNLDVVAAWLCTPGSKMLFHPYLFRAPELWGTLLQRIRTQPAELTYLLEPLKAFQGYHSLDFERVLLDQMMRVLPSLRADRRLSREFDAALRLLPEIPANSPDERSAVLRVLRAFIQTDLGKDAESLEQVVQSDLRVLPPEQRQSVLEAILDRLLVVRSLKMWDPKKVQQQMRTLLTNAAHTPELLEELLTAMANLELSKDTHKLLEELFVEMRDTLTEGETKPHIAALIDQILKPPASLLQQLRNIFKY